MSNFDEIDDFDDLDDSSQEDVEQLMEAFDKKVKRNMRVILSRKVALEKRVEAAYWLGESGAPVAIMALRKVYKAEKDPKMRQAAEYALGQFKAMDLTIERTPDELVMDALARPENEVIYQLMSDIVIKGEFGKRKRIPPSVLSRFVMLLTVILMVVVGLNAMLLFGGGGGLERQELGQANTGSASLDTLRDLEIVSGWMLRDAEVLQTQFAASAPDCTLDFYRPERYSVPPEVQSENFEVFTIANRMNATLNGLMGAQETFDGLCSEALPPQAEVDTAVTRVEQVLTEVPAIQTDITALADTIVPPTAEPAVVDDSTTPQADQTEQVVDLEPTIEPSPTLDPLLINSERSALTAIINNVTEPRGSLTVLAQAWQDVVASGRPSSCTPPYTAIPDDYTVPEDIAAEVPELAQAQERINDLGLALLRQGWESFTEQCNAGTLQANLTVGQSIVNTANSAFEEARTILAGISLVP